MTDYKKFFSSASIREQKASKQKINSINWNSDGKKLATGSSDSSIRLFTADRSSRLSDGSIELNQHTSSVQHVLWDSNNPDRLASASFDKTLRIWDTKSLKSPCMIIQTPGDNLNMAWSPDSLFLSTVTKDDMIHFYDLRNTSKPIKSFSIEPGVSINECRWNYEGNLFFVTTASGTVKIIGWPDYNLVYELRAHSAEVYCIDFCPKGRNFALGSSDALVSLWSMDDFTCFETCGKLSWPIRSIGFSHCGEFIASGADDPFIDISLVSTGKQVVSIPTNSCIDTLAWHPSRHLLAFPGELLEKSGRIDYYTLKLWGFN